MRRIKQSFDHLFQLKRSLLSLDIILTRDVNVANYLYLMSLFLLKESHVLMKETRAINIIIFKTIVFFVKKFFLIDVMTKCGNTDIDLKNTEIWMIIY